MTTATRLEVLTPTVEPISAKAVVAPRSPTLDGKVLGLLANGKRNSEEILDLVHEILADQYEFKGVVARNKRNVSRPCPSEIMDELVEQCDVVVTASGD